jgi:hypothetical protein
MPRRLLLATLLVVPATAGAGRVPLFAPPTSDAHPEVPVPPFYLPPPADLQHGAVEQLGEVVILEGDSTIVSDDGSGGFAVAIDMTTQNPVDITNRFYSVYPDEFDEIVVFTNFRDGGNPGALAYEVQVQNDVDGIGRAMLAQQQVWGSPTNLYAFVNMMWIDQYQKYDGLALTDARSLLYPTLGQEFAHRWLATLRYQDGQGRVSSALLGRAAAHWATTLQADASVMDGQRWVDNGDGTFTDVEQNARYSPLDLYGMGLLPPEKVPPWFLLHDAVDVHSGAAIDPTQIPGVGTKVKARREDITIAQVIAGSGARKPSFAASPKQFRVAFVLVTRPGERAVDVQDKALLLESVRKRWEAAFATFTGGAGSMCTQVSAPCGSPTARVLGGTIAEGVGANGNGIIEPGEPVVVTFTLANDGVGAATNVRVTASSPSVTFDGAVATLPELRAGDTATVALPGVMARGEALCGRPLTVEGVAAVGAHSWRGFVETTPGLATAYRAQFERDAGLWGRDLLGKDSVGADGDGWQWGHPVGYGFWIFEVQPSGGPGGQQNAWFTGLAKGDLWTGNTHSLPKGTSTLWSPLVDLSSVRHPRLRYSTWFEALDFSNPGPPVSAVDDHLSLEASNDGAAWSKLDQVDGAADRWQVRAIDLGPLVDAGRLHLDRPMQFRFTVNRKGDAEVVEAGVADFTVLSDAPLCAGPVASPDGGVDGGEGPTYVASGGCAVGGGGAARALCGLLALCLWLVVRRSRNLLRRS